MKQSLLQTERLILRPVKASDLQELWLIWRNNEVRRYLFDDEPVTHELAVETLLKKLVLNNCGLGLWLIQLHDSTSVGCVELRPSYSSLSRALRYPVEASIALQPKYWSKNYGYEALSALTEYAFNELSLLGLVAIADVTNLASHRLLFKLGFVPSYETDDQLRGQQLYNLNTAREIKI
jgi:[ribosomal protein S5]-alanine N-acetyltransferase